MPFLHKTAGSYTLNVNVYDLGNSKPILVYTNDGFEGIAQERSGENGSFSICSSLILNEQLEKIKKLFKSYPKIISVNAVNNYVTTRISKGNLTPLPIIVECKSNVSDVLANGSIRSYGPIITSKDTFTESSTGNSIGDAMNSARIVLSKKADSFLLNHQSVKDEIESNSTQTFYGTISYNNMTEPGERWKLSQEKLPVFTGYSLFLAISDTSEYQYFINGPAIYKLENKKWEKVFYFDGVFNSICVSGDGKYVTAGGIPSSQTNVSIYSSSDYGVTWSQQFTPLKI